MIIRIFRAKVHDGKQKDFENFFLTQAIPHVKSQNGLISLSIGKPIQTSPDEFMMIMTWRDLDSIKAFAGENWQKAVILEDERNLLKEVFVHHYETID